MYSTGTLIGGADGGAGTNQLNLAGGGGVGTITGVITDFQIIKVGAGVSWAVGGVGTATVTDNGMLKLTGTTQISSAVAGTGRLVLAGAATIVDGANLTVGTLAISGGATVKMTGTIDYAGTLVQAGGTQITIASGKTLTLHKGAQLNGAVVGAGKLVLAAARRRSPERTPRSSSPT